MTQPTDPKIPERSFGLCHWCGAESVRLQYLFCPKCFRIANMIPSKAMILLNRPDLKKRLGTSGITIRNITPELCAFLLNPQNHFPPDLDDNEHWGLMQKAAVENVTKRDIRFYLEDKLHGNPQYVIPPDEELTAGAGMEILVRFILRISVIRGLLKIILDDEEPPQIQEIYEEFANSTLQDSKNVALPKKMELDSTALSPHGGMKARDIIFQNLHKHSA